MIRSFFTVTAIAVLGAVVPAQMTQNCRPGVDAGIIACPCSNPPTAGGLGCDNFGGGPALSGTLDATGVPDLANDTITLHATGTNSSALNVFFVGSALHPTGLLHGAGVRCVTTSLKRLATGSASSGAISFGWQTGGCVSCVSGPLLSGDTRHYFNIYRDPNAAGPCGSTASTVNVTNSGSITWF